MKNILVTGASGFIGRNLVESLRQSENYCITQSCSSDNTAILQNFIQEADCIVHLAGVNRPQDESEFSKGNHDFTKIIIETLTKLKRPVPFLFSSSAQAVKENPYGVSKRQAEEAVFQYGRSTGASVYVYRLPNIFGKWCRPNYNSVVATFCHNIARDLPINISDPNVTLNLAYIDDVVDSFVSVLERKPIFSEDFVEVKDVYSITLGTLADLIIGFREMRTSNLIPKMDNPFVKKLYSTYLSYLPENQFSYPLKMNIDNRGSFTEFLKTPDRGQVSINISKPHISKGDHWHHTKNEKFLVVSGKAILRFRQIGRNDIIEYTVSGERLEVVDIPPGYSHHIINIGDSDLVTVMWANESFNPDEPDTFFEPVIQDRE